MRLYRNCQNIVPLSAFEVQDAATANINIDIDARSKCRPLLAATAVPNPNPSAIRASDLGVVGAIYF